MHCITQMIHIILCILLSHFNTYLHNDALVEPSHSIKTKKNKDGARSSGNGKSQWNYVLLLIVTIKTFIFVYLFILHSFKSLVKAHKEKLWLKSLCITSLLISLDNNHYHLLSLESSSMSFLIPIHRQQKSGQ